MRTILLLFLTAAVLRSAPPSATAAKPLAEAAQAMAPSLQAGCIVTAERIGTEETKFSIAGSAPGDPASCETILFEIGSITKVFTGLLLAQAVSEKRVALDTPIGALLGPNQKYADERVPEITLRQLATHTSGLPRLPSNLAGGADDPYARYDETALRACLATAVLKGEAPFRCSYSNLGMGLLGHLLGQVWKTTWAEAVAAKVCAPLGLHDTSAALPGSQASAAPPFNGAKPSTPWTFQAIAGAGALRSNAADLTRLGEAMLHPETTPLAEAFKLAMAPQAEAPAEGGHIGLGIFIRKIDGALCYHHDGGTGGYRSSLEVIPAQSAVRVVLINNTTLSGSEIIAAARPSAATIADPGKQAEVNLPHDVLAQYPGVYILDNDARFTVLMNRDQLWVRLTGQPFFRVFARARDLFFYKAVAAEIRFQRNGDRIEALTLLQNGKEKTAVRSEEPVPAIQLRSAKDLEPYAGSYSLMGLKDLTLTVRSNTLFAQLAGQPAVPVFETAADRFEYDVVEAALLFSRDTDNHINGLTLLQNGVPVPAPRKAAASP